MPLCQAAKAGRAAFTEDYEFFVRAFTAENSDNSDQWANLMSGGLSSWRNRMRNTTASTPNGWKARQGVLKLIKRSRYAVVDLFMEAVRLQVAGQRDGALDFFVGGQRVLAKSAIRVLPRLRAINCGY